MGPEHYFPNVPAESLAIEGRLRKEAVSLPEETRCHLYEILSEAHEAFVSTRFELQDRFLIAYQRGQQIAFPRPLPMVKHSHILCDYEEWLEHKYALPEFVGVEAGDVVIDCGAYVGGFSLSAAKIAGHLHAFEPAPDNFACLRRNLGQFGNVTLTQSGLYSTTQTMTLNISGSSVEHSLLRPDDGEPIDTQQIEVVALSDYCLQHGIERIDFLKLEAEGVEPEIFDGLGFLQPRKLAIDVSPEREGLSPASHFQTILPQLGYEVRLRGHVMFARR
ncbi:MAG: FkbM family methyltransferase [Hyphomonadaceae bacterium]